jgi:3-oxoacyl-[acyl-carrier-protein] synthase II
VDAARSSEGRVRVVVTGLGAVTPFGWGVEAFEHGLFHGRPAIDELQQLPSAGHRTSIGGEVRAEDTELADLAPRPRSRLTRTDGFAVYAAREALAHAGLDHAPASAGVFVGTSTGGMLEGEHFFSDLRADGSRRMAMSRLAAQQQNGPTDAVARTLGLGGPSVTLSSACSAATMALEAALESLRAGETDVALAGGADALCQLTYAGFNSLRAVDEASCRPFQADRAGLSLGEGAGILVLETEAHARARGATILAELAGAGSSCDAHHMTAPDPSGAGLALAIRKALGDAGLGADGVDVINAHGTATPLNDAAEWSSLALVFGARASEIPLMTTKAFIGHLLGACGGAEAVASVLALTQRRVPVTPGEGAVDPECPARLVRGAPESVSRAETVLSVNLAFGGANAAALFRREPSA